MYRQLKSRPASIAEGIEAARDQAAAEIQDLVGELVGLPKLSVADAVAASAAEQAAPPEAAPEVPSVLPPQVQSVFDSLFDQNKDGVLSIAEVHAGLARLDIEIPKEQMGAVFQKYDKDGNLSIDKQEFYEMYRQLKSRPASIVPSAPDSSVVAPKLSADAQEAFDTAFDRNADGTLSVSEVHRGLKKLGIKVPPEEMSSIFSNFDTDNSFRLDAQEFYELFRKYKAQTAAN